MPTHTILHTRLEVISVTDFHAIPKSVYNRTQAKKAIPRHTLCLTDSDYDYILGEIGCQYNIWFKRDVEVYSDNEENQYIYIYILTVIRFLFI